MSTPTFKDLPQPMNVTAALEIVQMTTAASDASTIRTVSKLVEQARVSPQQAMAAQASVFGDKGLEGKLRWFDFWCGVAHGLTIAIASGDPEFVANMRKNHPEIMEELEQLKKMVQPDAATN